MLRLQCELAEAAIEILIRWRARCQSFPRALAVESFQFAATAYATAVRPGLSASGRSVAMADVRVYR